MPIFEVQTKPAAPLRGRVLNVQLAGIFVTAAQYADWVDNDIEPDLSGISNRGHRVAGIRRKVAHWKYFSSPSFDATVAAQTRWADFDTATNRQAHRLSVMQDQRDVAVTQDTRNRANGFDSNWGWMDMMITGIVVADIPRGRAEALMGLYADTRFPPPHDERVRKHGEWRLVAGAVPVPLRNRWQDDQDLVLLDRAMTPLTWSDFERFPNNILEP